jgi:hypothetical protein
MTRDVITVALVLGGVTLGAIAALDWIGYSAFVFSSWAW